MVFDLKVPQKIARKGPKRLKNIPKNQNIKQSENKKISQNESHQYISKLQKHI